MHIGLIGGIGPTGAFKPKPTVLGNPLPHNYLSGGIQGVSKNGPLLRQVFWVLKAAKTPLNLVTHFLINDLLQSLLYDRPAACRPIAKSG
jgi:hypothetical protein